MLESRRGVRLAARVHARLGARAAALLVGAFGLASFLRIAPRGHPRARVMTVAVHENARRQVARVCSWIGPEECGALVTKSLAPSALAGLTALVRRGNIRRLLRTIRAVDRRHGFLVSCRVAAAIAWYSRSRSILSARRPGAILVSSDSNPEEVGFIGAARALAIPQVFISHAYPTPLSPPLDFTLSILEGEAAVAARRQKGPIRGAVVLAGVEGDSAPLDASRVTRSEPVIGIFASKALSWTTAAAVVDDCRNHLRARQVVIRWHPSMLEPPRLGHVLDDLSRVVVSPRAAALADVARQCDWVIADENSNVHLQVLKLGIPTVVVRQLGIYPESRSDQYGFVANGIIVPPLASLRDLETAAVIDFFSDGWAERFARYDASYLRSPEVASGDVRIAIQALLNRTSSEVPAR